jgi:hypothetical protein
MFEPPLKVEPSSNKGVWIGAAVVVLAAIAIVIYLGSKSSVSKPAPASAPAAVATNVKADPIHDLHILSAEMSKDSTGTIAQWVVEIRNDSPAYTYSAISYQTTYVGGDSTVLSQNTGIIPISIGPHQQQTAQLRDIQYPTGTSWYRFQILDAKSAKQ